MRDPARASPARVALILLAVAWSLLPIVLVVSASLKPAREIFETPPRLLFLPTAENYVRLWRTAPEFFRNLANSLIVTAGATLVTVACSSLAGYVYARYSSRLLAASGLFMVVVRMLPPIVIVLPLFPAMNALGLHDTRTLLVLLYSAFYVSLGTWVMRAFIQRLPRELEEAAFVDGAGLGTVIWRVILPLAAQGLVAVSVFVTVFAWNEYVFALVFTTRDAKTAPLVIGELLGTADGIEWGVLFAAATVQLLPVLVAVMLLQRYIVAGLTAGAVKS
jgi:multiple sugar transport system permease protein